MSSLSLPELKTALNRRIRGVCRFLLPNGRLVGDCWRCGSLRGDSGQSLCITLSGEFAGRFRDFNTGERGDVLDLWQRTRKVAFNDAIQETQDWLTIDIPAVENTVTGVHFETSSHIPKAQSVTDEISEGYAKGARRLVQYPCISKLLDRWRGWPSGTTVRLAELQHISLLILGSEGFIAFGVWRDGHPRSDLIRLHLRKPPFLGTTSGWSYYPPRWTSTITPLVFGFAELTGAHTVIFVEGEWDAIALVSATRWLFDQWPTGVVVVAIRGASAVNQSLKFLESHLKTRPNAYVLADKDEAGVKMARTIQNYSGLFSNVIALTPAVPDCNDVNDLVRQGHIPFSLTDSKPTPCKELWNTIPQ